MSRWAPWVRQIHIYAGLQALLGMSIFGLTGLCATWTHSPYFEPPPAVERRLPLPSAARTDRELVDAIFSELAIPLAPRPPNWAIKQLGEGRIGFRVETPTSLTHVTIDRAAGDVLVSHRPLGFAEIVVLLHRLTPTRVRDVGDMRLFAWSLYIEFCVWALCLFIATGAYLGLSSRPRRRVAGLALACGVALFVGTILVL